MKLLERQDLMARLQSMLADAERGNGRVVALSGEVGVGKTVLARAFAELVGEKVRVLWGACEDLATPEPLGPLQEIARSAGWDLQGAVARGGRLAAFSEARASFEREGSASLLVIEDLHWADDATVDFVRFLGRRIGDTRILLLLTARSDEPAGRARLRRCLVDIPANNVARIDVPLLTEEAVADLARAAMLDAAAIYRLTAGNAFYVTELIRAAGAGALPASVNDAVLARADRLSAAARSLLDAVSIFPRRAEIAFVNATLGRDCLAEIEEGAAVGILTISGEACCFRHEVARRAIESALAPGRRRGLNAAALAALRKARVAATRLAHHAHEANDAAAVRKYAPVAGEEASRLGAHREAVEHFRRALAHTNTFGLDERLALYERFAFECHLIGRTREALSGQKSALDLYRAMGDIVREGDSLRWLSRLSYLDGNRADADRFGQQAVDVLEPLPPGAELAMAYSNMSQLAMLGNDPDAAVAWADKAITLAGPATLDRPDIVCHALNNIGTAVQWRCPGDARDRLERSLETALANDFPEHAARTYTNRGCLGYNLLADAEARAWLEAGIGYCIERDLDTWRDYMRAWLADVHLRQGRLDEAATVAELVRANDDAAPLARYPANLVLAKVRTRRGDPADDLVRELAGYLETGMELQRFAPYAALMAERAWLGLSDREAALALLDKARSMASDANMIAYVLWWQRMLGAEATSGDMGGMPRPFALVFAGDWRSAALSWQALGAPYEQGLSLLEGDGQAQRSALDLFEALGAAAASARVRELLRQGGIRIVPRGPRATTRSNPWGLTKRQIDVLKLIDQGRSNGQIAGALFISAKTVDHHISAILDKLQARSRGEAAAVARNSGLILN
ncbi:AAA family ATPase [Mesorhizobium sp. KR9-304]|uniref:ATP-binding protein n=1 Tax=Mesorhizobium sp. KR9-304 TaxID=3156614 RepID=UPI0032B5F5A4